MKTVKSVLAVVSAVSLTVFFGGCPSRESYLQKHSPAFVQGYRSGCENGRESARNSFIERKPPERYFSDSEYKEGWDEGYESCYEDEEFEQQMSRPAIFRE